MYHPLIEEYAKKAYTTPSAAHRTMSSSLRYSRDIDDLTWLALGPVIGVMAGVMADVYSDGWYSNLQTVELRKIFEEMVNYRGEPLNLDQFL